MYRKKEKKWDTESEAKEKRKAEYWRRRDEKILAERNALPAAARTAENLKRLETQAEFKARSKQEAEDQERRENMAKTAKKVFYIIVLLLIALWRFSD